MKIIEKGHYTLKKLAKLTDLLGDNDLFWDTLGFEIGTRVIVKYNDEIWLCEIIEKEGRA